MHADPLQALTPRERSRLAAILARLASPFENERAIAGLLASAFIAKRDLVWTDLTALLSQRPPPQAACPPVQERRRGGRSAWRGYCRRRVVPCGQALTSIV